MRDAERAVDIFFDLENDILACVDLSNLLVEVTQRGSLSSSAVMGLNRVLMLISTHSENIRTGFRTAMRSEDAA